MRKILFTVACVTTLLLSSCFENTGYSSTNYFVRVVTIDANSSPVKFVADYTGEVFKDFTNLKQPEQLAEFDLTDAKRAEVLIKLDTDASYKQTITLEQAQEIEVQSVTNSTPTDSMKPFYSWIQKPLGGDYAPIAWVADGYLNVVPVIPSEQPGKYFLTAEKVTSDTLFFRLDATYTPSKSLEGIEGGVQCYDLRTLKDTLSADSTQRIKMIEALDAIEQHKNDSMRIVLTGTFEYQKINGKDTIGDLKVITDYFKCKFIQ